MTRTLAVGTLLVAGVLAPGPILAGTPYTRETVVIRGQEQTLHVYGSRAGIPVIMGSGDLGWTGISVHIAQALGARGYWVVGFNVRAYLSSFTGHGRGVLPGEVPGDYRAVLDWMAQRRAA